MSEELKKEWVSEFNEMWYSHDGDHFYKEEWHDFIKHLLAKQQADFVKCIPEDKQPEEETFTYDIFENTENMNRVFMRVGYRKCIADIKSKLLSLSDSETK